MGFKFFTIPVRNEGTAEAELNNFLQRHHVLAVDRRWVEQGADSFWSFCVDYLDRSAGDPKQRDGSRERSKDYKEILSPDDFALFARLRDLRKEISQTEAVPVYTIFTNEQLAQIAQSRCSTKADLEKIAGVGSARIEKYGSKFIELLSKEPKKTNEADRPSV